MDDRITTYPYWVDFADKTLSGCVYAETPRRALWYASQVHFDETIVSAKPLPYGAFPIIFDPEPDTVRFTFCYKPEKCCRSGRCMADKVCTS